MWGWADSQQEQEVEWEWEWVPGRGGGGDDLGEGGLPLLSQAQAAVLAKVLLVASKKKPI